MTTPGPTPETTLEETLAVFTEADRPCTPRTASETAEELGCTRRTAHRKLEALAERGDLDTKKVGARSRVWWRPRDAGSSTPSGEVAIGSEQFGEFVRAVEGYAIFTLDPDGHVASWNEGAERIKGYTEEEIVGDHFSTFYPEEDVEAGIPDRNLEVAREKGRYEDEGWRVRADGTTFWANIVITAIRDDDGSLLGFTKVTRDLTDRKRAQDALRRERESLDRILEASPAGVAVFSEEGEVVRSNPRAAEILGVQREELAQYSRGDRTLLDESGEPVPLEDRPVAQVLETGDPVYDWPCQVEQPDGQRRWVSLSAAPIEDEADEIEQVVVVGEDLTELKERERTLSRERDFVEQIIETVPASVGIVNRDGEFERLNETARTRLGVAKGEPFEASDQTLYDEDGNRIPIDELPSRRVLRTGEPIEGWEGKVDRPDGVAWVSISVVPLGDEDPPERVLVSSNDVTRLKEQARQLERQRDELEAELGDVFERVDDAFYALDEEWRFTYVNERAEEILQRDEGELLGENVWQAFPPAADGPIWDNFHRAVEEQEAISFEMYSEVLDFWAELSVYPSETGLSVYMRDVTDRIERERELEQYRQIVETVDDGVYVLDDDSRFLAVNDAHVELTGYTREELVGSHATLVTHDTVVERADRKVEELKESGGAEFTIESELVRPDGETVAVETRVSLYDLPAGGTGRVGVVRDVTERRERERALAESEARYRSLTDDVLDTSEVGTFILDSNFEIVWINQAMEEYFGIDRESVVGADKRKLIDERIADIVEDSADFRERVIATYEENTDTEEFECHVLGGDGREERWLRHWSQPIESGIYAGGRIEHYTDLTDRKEYEHELERYEALIEESTDVNAIVDPDGTLEYVTPSVEYVLGYDPEEMTGQNAFEYIHPDDREETAQELATLTGEAGDRRTVEFRIRHADGSWVWLESRGRNLSDDETIDGLVVYTRDVTDRKHYERELEQFETLIEESTDVNAVLDPNGVYEYITPSTAHVMGYDPEELIGENAFEYIHPDDREETAEEYFRMVEEPDYRASAEFRFRHADGSWVWLEARGRNLLDDPQIDGIVAYTRDVTDRKEYERQLEARARQQEVISELGQHALEYSDVDVLFEEASRLVAETLDNDYCKVLDLDRRAGELTLRQGVGWDEGIVGNATVAADDNSQAGFTLQTEEPVVVTDLDSETRFAGPELLTSHDVTSGVSTIIGSMDDPWGILGTHDTEEKSFGEEDVTFVQNVANVLTTAIDRATYERELERYRQIIETVNDGVYTVDADGRFTMVNEAYAEMTGYAPQALIGQHVSTTVAEDAVEEAREREEQLLAGEDDTGTLEAELLTADGGTVPAEATFALLPGRERDYERVGIVRDITERRERQRAIEESERRYRTLVENFPNGAVALFDEDLQYTVAGGSSLEDVGPDPEDVVGRIAGERYDDELADRFERHLRAAIDGESTTFEAERRGRHWHVRALPVEDDAGEIFAGMVMVQDVTERVQRERELERTLDLLAKAERIADVGGWEIDVDTEEVFWTDHLFDILEVSYDEEPLFEQTLDVYHEEDRPIIEGAVQEAIGSGEPFDVEARFPRPGGDVGWLHVQGDPEVVAGEVVSLRGAVQDVTERRRREERLEELIDRLEESNERLEQFAYVASHDLQEPLRMVSNYLQLVERRYADVLDEDGEEFIEFAVDGADRMRQMINDLLDYSRVDTKAEPFEPTDSEAVIEDVLRNLELQIQENDAEVEVGSLPTVPADRNQLEQVFQNLVSNAIKYRDEEPPRIEVDAELDGDAWEFRVADNGIGIDPEHADRIFDVFERLHTSEEYSGTGIGLALCEKIVDRHGGDIRVDSTPGEGSTFFFTLPVEREDDEPRNTYAPEPGRDTDD